MEEQQGNKGRAALYIVGTPIGNLDDMTPRAIKTLREVDIIAAEDTRRVAKLLKHFAIAGKQTMSYYDHVEAEKAAPLIARLIEQDLTLALVSDAGTPCIADPGYRLVAEARRRGLAVHPIPGPSAMTALVSVAGLPSDRLLFVGFLPTKQGALLEEIASWRHARGSIVFFEAPRRLCETLTEIRNVYPHAQICIGRELTKLHEETARMPVADAIEWSKEPDSLRGEAAVMVYPACDGSAAHEARAEEIKGDAEALLLEARKAYAAGMSLRDLLDKFKDCGFNRSDLYRLLLQAKIEDTD